MNTTGAELVRKNTPFVNAVGIDVSKGKSMVAVMRPMGEVVMKPREFEHNTLGLKELVKILLPMIGDTRIVMEATGRYHEPIVQALMSEGMYVSVLNPILIKQSGGGSVRKVKTDKKDALKIAKYALDNWTDLRQYCDMDATREQLKLLTRQYDTLLKTVIALKNNLIALLDKTFPGVNNLFESAEKADGHQKWVDFVLTFWHSDCVSSMSLKAFSERYHKWCKKNHYNFSEVKAIEIHAMSRNCYTTLRKSDVAKLLLTTSTNEVIASSKNLALIRNEAIRLAQTLPEYQVVDDLYGVGEISAAQLMGELADVRRFANRRSIIAFAGIDPAVNESGTYASKSNKTTKRGSPHLRKTLFLVVSAYHKKSPIDEPVYQFLAKKRAEGKPYYVYMTAAANKFLRIYYARVKECLNAFDASAQVSAQALDGVLDATVDAAVTDTTDASPLDVVDEQSGE